MVELVDTLDSESSARKGMGVQISLSAPVKHIKPVSSSRAYFLFNARTDFATILFPPWCLTPFS